MQKKADGDEIEGRAREEKCHFKADWLKEAFGCGNCWNWKGRKDILAQFREDEEEDYSSRRNRTWGIGNGWMNSREGGK